MEKTRDLIFRSIAFSAVLGHMASSSCSTTQVEPMAVLPPAPPAYVEVPHPEGADYADVLEIFTDRQAPGLDELKDCDATFQKLRASAESRDEMDEGATELVRLDPIKYHWCFYGKIVTLEDRLHADAYLDEKQKAVLDTYAFLTPLARAYMKEYNDSRYMRWAIARYKKASEYVFFRKLEMTPKASRELASATNPFVRYKAMTDQKVELKYGVLEKYKLMGMEGTKATFPNPEAAAQAQAALPAPGVAPPAKTTAAATTPAPTAAPLPVAPTPAVEPTTERAPASTTSTAPSP